MRALNLGLALIVLSFTPGSSLASDASPIGRWLTIDDKDGKPRSVIAISDAGGVLQGTVAKIYDRPGDNPQHLCRKCNVELKDRPVIGMTILNGLKADGDSWDGGTILDPDSGKIYSATIHLSDVGQKLVVRGYIGISLIGRSQTWIREGSVALSK